MTRPLPRSALAALVALIVAAPSTAAPRTPLSQFDVGAARDIPEVLALCDLTAFLVTGPNLDADVIFAPDDHSRRWMRAMRHPYFRPVDTLFDIRTRDAFLRLESASLVRRADVAAARNRFDVPMLESYRYAGPADRLFLDRQLKVCDGLVSGYLRDPVAQIRAPAAPHG